MKVEAVFGVRTSDLDEARGVLDKLLKAEAEARENSSRGGDYYLYRGHGGAKVYLMKNEEPEDGTPLYDEAAKWEFILRINSINDDDPWLLAIKGDPDRFTSVIYDEIE